MLITLKLREWRLFRLVLKITTTKDSKSKSRVQKQRQQNVRWQTSKHVEIHQCVRKLMKSDWRSRNYLSKSHLQRKSKLIDHNLRRFCAINECTCITCKWMLLWSDDLFVVLMLHPWEKNRFDSINQFSSMFDA